MRSNIIKARISIFFFCLCSWKSSQLCESKRGGGKQQSSRRPW